MADVDGVCEGFKAFSVKESIVYLILEGNNDPDGPLFYKVGKTDNSKTRLRDLQTGNPRKLEYVLKFTVKDMTAAENRAKEALKTCYKCKLGGGTEWYEVELDERGNLIKKFEDAVANKPVEKRQK